MESTVVCVGVHFQSIKMSLYNFNDSLSIETTTTLLSTTLLPNFHMITHSVLHIVQNTVKDKIQKHIMLIGKCIHLCFLCANPT